MAEKLRFLRRKVSLQALLQHGRVLDRTATPDFVVAPKLDLFSQEREVGLVRQQPEHDEVGVQTVQAVLLGVYAQLVSIALCI